MRPIALCTIAMLTVALAGCEKKVDVKNESAQSVASKVAAADLKFQPGRWESTMKFVKLDVPGAPPEAKKMMEAMMGKGRVFASCLTPEEAEKPRGKFFGQESKDCTYEHFTMGGGKIDGKLVCKGGQGQQTIAMTGSYTPASYDMTMDMAMTGGAVPGANMNMTMAMASKRVGDCTGKDES